jgi:hypothetical protein
LAKYINDWKAKFTAYCTYGLWFYSLNKQTENTIITNILHRQYVQERKSKPNKGCRDDDDDYDDDDDDDNYVHELPAEGRLSPQNRSMLTCL